MRQLAARDIGGALKAIEQWKSEASKAGHEVRRVVVRYEAGLDGFWIARALRERWIEVYVMHPASISVERRGRRAKTDRIDVEILLRALLGWLLARHRLLSQQLKEIETARERVVAAFLRRFDPAVPFATTVSL